MNLNTEICNSFNTHASEYEQAAKVQYEIGARLFERLHYLKMKPRFVLDLGCGPGNFTQLLKKHYPKTTVVALDLSYVMLQQAKKKQGLLSKWPLVNGEMTSMPFAAGQFDLIFANQVIHWSDSLSRAMRELNRVLHQGGCLMFSTLGPDTFRELKQPIEGGMAHANEFLDMHDVGDCLLAERFLDPVVDMELLTAHYASVPHLFKALKRQGVRNINPLRNQGLTGKASWTNFEQSVAACRTPEGKIPLTYEVIYGHAWKGMQQRSEQGIETYIPLSSLRLGS